ncbi:MAG: FtsQ-type POTRA domain-containing protein [Desulfobulbaceae bacterium]|uniref:FtsQ-type POTRA domain-containing protein n=1 Tax=Candidatus Desulfatifera sulfidica TaxID=2841691 RepID=A0A8J6NAP1_9BACT|nr:FtsQ-type POTRA domain-containing protein [Candidatus Desulfatifera sulfidica]
MAQPGYHATYGDMLQQEPKGLLAGLAGRVREKVNAGQGNWRERWQRRGLCLAVTFAGLFLVALFIRGPLLSAVAGINSFQVRDIVINGCRITTPSLIREMTGLGYDLNLIKIDLPALEREITTHPWIKRATVQREWPDVLRVDVVEYRPEAMIALQESGDDAFFYVDRSGVIFSPVKVGQDLDFPVITGFYDRADVENRRAHLADILTFIKLARKNNPNLPWQNVSEISVDELGGVVLYLVEKPFPIYLGHGEIKHKYSRLKRVLKALYGKKEKIGIDDVAYIQMDYQKNKVLVAQSAVN